MYQPEFHHPHLAVPEVGTARFREWTTAVGFELAHGGVPPVEAQLRALARRARELQVEPVATGVLADRGEAEVARARAFSHVVSTIAAVTAGDRRALGATA